MKKKISITIDDKMLKEVDRTIDHIYVRNRSFAIEALLGRALGENRIAVILCGGIPSQLELSPGLYRPTARVGRLTVIEKAVMKLRESHFREIYVIASQAVLTKIFEILKDGSQFNADIHYVEEKNSRGTANSLRLLRGKISTRFLIVYGDIVFSGINLEELWSQQVQGRALATLLLTTTNQPSEKGVVTMEGQKIHEFIQKPKMAKNYVVFAAIFAAEPDLLEVEGQSLEYDVFPELAKRGLLEGHLTSAKESHVHSLSDLKKAV